MKNRRIVPVLAATLLACGSAALAALIDQRLLGAG